MRTVRGEATDEGCFRTLTVVVEDVLMGRRVLPTLELITTAEGAPDFWSELLSTGAEEERGSFFEFSSTSSAAMLGCCTITCTSPGVT